MVNICHKKIIKKKLLKKKPKKQKIIIDMETVII